MSLIDTIQNRLSAIDSELDGIVATAEKHKRNVSPGEQTNIEALLEERKSAVTILDDARKAEDQRTANGAALAKIGFTGGASTSSRGGIYTPESRHSMFLDMFDARQGDSGARERLDRHGREFRDAMAAEPRKELRAGGTTVTGAGGEFAPPLWLVDDYIEALRPARATADALTNLPLPEGTDVINVPKVATGTAVALQTTQNTGVNVQDITTSTVAAPVLTIAGGAVYSRQLFDQSPIAGHMDRVLLGDLMADYARQIGSFVLNGTGAGGQPTGLITAAGNTIAYTDASPAFMGVGKLYAQIGKAVQTVQTTRFLSPTALVMHPRRWAWASVQVDTAGRAVILPDGNGPLNASGIESNGAAQGVVGKMFGLPVIVDPNIPTNLGAGTNQDPIIVVKADDSWLYESALKAEVFPETYANQLSMFARVYAYFALAHRISASIAVINGTGLVAPTF
ncbi:phage major capsid protein [Diaminobutyricibacter sp. McL0618]|uniref:phage major capsid protein n=1 Tax=Leifsonia sp. McL0618 TaxID=3415677 RepID=UPI003CEB4993